MSALARLLKAQTDPRERFVEEPNTRALGS